MQVHANQLQSGMSPQLPSTAPPFCHRSLAFRCFWVSPRWGNATRPSNQTRCGSTGSLVTKETLHLAERILLVFFQLNFFPGYRVQGTTILWNWTGIEGERCRRQPLNGPHTYPHCTSTKSVFYAIKKFFPSVVVTAFSLNTGPTFKKVYLDPWTQKHVKGNRVQVKNNC